MGINEQQLSNITGFYGGRRRLGSRDRVVIPVQFGVYEGYPKRITELELNLTAGNSIYEKQEVRANTKAGTYKSRLESPGKVNISAPQLARNQGVQSEGKVDALLKKLPVLIHVEKY